MADRRLAIEVTVEGDAVRVFKEIGAAAKTAAGEVAQSGERAQKGVERIEKAATSAETAVEGLEVAQKKAAKAADEMAQHSEKSARSLDRYRDSLKQIGTGMGALGTAFTMYANQAREHERTLIAVERMYGSAADSYVQFAERIQGTTIFSNDEALEAARIMGTLRENYDLTDQQIQQLIQTSADLASIHGVTLADAAQRVQSAIRGEAESAEALGLTMNQAAIDAQGLTLTMSNAEAAQFRFNAMMQQTSSSVGAAAEVASTTSGQVQQLANEFQDGAMAVVRFTGPVGDAASALGTFGIQGGLAAGGLVQLGRGIATAAAAAGGFTALMGPAGLIVLGLGAAAAAATLFSRAIRDDAAEAMKTARVEGERLDETISGLTSSLTGIDLNFYPTIIGSDDALDELAGHLEYWKYLIDEFGSLPTAGLDFPTDGMTEQERLFLEQQRQAIAYMDQYAAELGSVEEAANALAEAEKDLNSILMHRGAGRETLLTELSELVRAFETGEITIFEYIAGLDALEKKKFELDNDAILDMLHAEEQAVIDTTLAWIDYEQAISMGMMAPPRPPASWTGSYTDAENNRTNAGVIRTQAENELIEKRLRLYHVTQTALNGATLAAAGFHVEIGEGNAEYAKVAPMFETTARAIEGGAEALDEFNYALFDGKQDVQDLSDELDRAMRSASGLGDALYDIRARGGTVAVDLAVNTGGAQRALDSGFSAIVGGSNALGQSAQQVADWSASLTHGNFLMTKMDQLFMDGAISAKTYRDALDANHRIQEANNSVQEDVLRIQAKQLPVMAQLAEEHARYVDQLADEDVQTQTVALGYMDQTKAAQAMALANLAATASMAGMGDSAGEMILQMAEADPILKAMLIDMKLISDTDGVLRMNTDQATSATDVLKELNTTVEKLSTLLDRIFLATIGVDDQASDPIDSISNKLINLDGKSATVAVSVLTTGPIGLLAETAATGKTFFSPEPMRVMTPELRGYATGGHLALVGEAGPELVTLPAGAQVTNAAGTRGRLNPMGRSRSRGAGTQITNKGPVSMTVVVDSDPNALRRAGIQGQRR